VRLLALALAIALLAGCGATDSGGAFGDVTLALDAKPDANDVGVYLASARGYDEAEGVLFKVVPRGPADFSLRTDAELRRSRDLVGVMAIVQPAKLVLCVSRETLDEQRAMVKAAVRALQRGYQQAQLEPDEAVQAMAAQVPGLDTTAVAAQLDRDAPTWSTGPFLGALPAGREFDRTVASPRAANQ
jgi:ABC-type nitrate/sulfonate/bicarbonate transport system substrate-binding protein